MSWISTGPWPTLNPSTSAPKEAKEAKEAKKEAAPKMPASTSSQPAKGKGPAAAAGAAAPPKDQGAKAASGAEISVKEVQELLLNELQKVDSIKTRAFAKERGLDLQLVSGAVLSLSSKLMVVAELVESQEWTLSEEGKTIAKEGSHEAKVFLALPEGGLPQPQLMESLGESAKIGLGKALKNGWVALANGIVTKKASTITDLARQQLSQLEEDPSGASLDKNTLADLKKRKLANNVTITSHSITKGPDYSTTIVPLCADLDQSMLASGEWKTKAFKKYNFNAKGLPPQGGHLHPLLKVREEFRNIFLEMGFSEMPTNNFVESSFWNFDTLFQPQQHPARDAHDTFFLKDPERATSFPQEYLEAVKKVHAEGGFGSLGYRYDWKLEEAQKNIFRTHTTAVSARMLYKLAQEKEFRPAKYFSIDRVFRNETLDATHLAEFHQIEGLIADYDLSLGDLIGTLEAFFKKLGMNRLRFKPAYNPYTEPSMEVFAYHEGLKKWVEIGNSGVFRPEMLLPMGLPPNVFVIAWGLSLERPTMIKYGINNIRDLCGHKIDLEVVQKNPICRMDKI